MGLKSALEMWQRPFQPDDTPDIEDMTRQMRSTALHVGVVALALPVIMWLGTVFDVCAYDSLSHFYYAQFLGPIFVGSLVFIGAFLIAYRGETKAEAMLASLAGVFAIATALFPTSSIGCEQADFLGRAMVRFDQSVTAQNPDGTPLLLQTDVGYFALFEYGEWIHLGAATMVFLFLAFMSGIIFTRIVPSRHRGEDDVLLQTKVMRNVLYYSCSVIILLCIVVLTAGFLTGAADAGTPWDDINFTFWLEGTVLWAFGISWMVKSRVFHYPFSG